jgi:hypothetical protein
MPTTRVRNPFLPAQQIGAGLDSIARAMFSKPGPLQQEALERKNFAMMADAAASEARAGAAREQGRLHGAQADNVTATGRYRADLRAPEGLDVAAANLAGLDINSRDSWTPEQTQTFLRARGSGQFGLADDTINPAQIAAALRTAQRTGFEGDVFSGQIDPFTGAARGNAASASPRPTIDVDGDTITAPFGTEGMPTDVVRRMFKPTELGGAKIQTEGARQGTERARTGLYGAQTHTEGARQGTERARTGLYGAQTHTEGARQGELASRTAFNRARTAGEQLVPITVTDRNGNLVTTQVRRADHGREAAQLQFSERQPASDGAPPRTRLFQNEIEQMQDAIVALTGANSAMPLRPDVQNQIQAEATRLALSGPPELRGNMPAAVQTAIENLFPGENPFESVGNWNLFVTNETRPRRSAVDSGQVTPPPAGGERRIKNEAEYNALPPGATYIDPNGVRRIKGGG